MARRLLNNPALRGLFGLVLIVPLLSGCLVTDDIEVRPADPPKVNNAPSIVGDSAQPSALRPIELGQESNNCSVDLKIGVVSDADVDDILYVRWFVDYDDSPGAALQPVYSPGSIPPSGSAERAGDAAKFTFRATDFPRGVHVVTVVVSDGFGDNGSPKAPAEGRGSDSYSWAIDSSNAVSCKTTGGGL